MVSPCVPHLLADNEKMYTPITAYNDMSIIFIIENELKSDSSWRCVYHFLLENTNETISVENCKLQEARCMQLFVQIPELCLTCF